MQGRYPSLGCSNTVSYTGWLKLQVLISHGSGRCEVQGHGAGMVEF